MLRTRPGVRRAPGRIRLTGPVHLRVSRVPPPKQLPVLSVQRVVERFHPLQVFFGTHVSPPTHLPWMRDISAPTGHLTSRSTRLRPFVRSRSGIENSDDLGDCIASRCNT